MYLKRVQGNYFPMSLSKVNQICTSWIANQTPSQILFIVVFLESLAIVLAIRGAISAGYSPKAFFEEGGYMTILSCLQLLGSAFVARKTFLLARLSPHFMLNEQSSLWRTVSWGLFFLTVDDALQVHEHIDKLLHFLLRIWLNFEETPISDLADDAIVGGYLLFFAFYVVRKWRLIKIFRRSWLYFQLGFILTMVMVIFDAASNNLIFISMLTDNSQQQFNWQIWFGTFEDSVKIYAEGLFFVGIYKCWRIAKGIGDRAQTDLQPERLFSYKKDK